MAFLGFSLGKWSTNPIRQVSRAVLSYWQENTSINNPNIHLVQPVSIPFHSNQALRISNQGVRVGSVSTMKSLTQKCCAIGRFAARLLPLLSSTHCWNWDIHYGLNTSLFWWFCVHLSTNIWFLGRQPFRIGLKAAPTNLGPPGDQPYHRSQPGHHWNLTMWIATRNKRKHGSSTVVPL